MRKPHTRWALGTAPRERVPRQPPPLEAKRPAPKGDVPPPHAVSFPKSRGVGAPPNPRTPAVVRHVRSGLNDLFALFGDLPRPRRPPRRPRPSR